MKSIFRSFAAIFALLMFMLCASLPVLAVDERLIPPDGSYTMEVALAGGSGKAHITSPCKIVVEDGVLTATIEWSSPNYDYMIADGKKYLPVNTEGNSVFEIEVPSLAEPYAVKADTVAMSTPHEIDYTLTFTPSTIKVRRSEKQNSQIITGAIVGLIIAVIYAFPNGIKRPKFKKPDKFNKIKKLK